MRSHTEKLLVAALLSVPVLIALVGWPAFLNWAAGPVAQPTPQAAGAPATSVAAARANAPTARPTVGAPATLDPRATAVVVTATPAPAVTPTPAVAATAARTPVVAVAGAAATQQPTAAASEARPTAPAPTPARRQVAAPRADNPSTAVADFYALVAQHDFGDAADLWSPRMQATFPPTENINQRFSATQSVAVRRADVISQDESTGHAAVAVDVLESTGGTSRHWVGTWYLVRGPSGWLLDQPQLQSE